MSPSSPLFVGPRLPLREGGQGPGPSSFAEPQLWLREEDGGPLNLQQLIRFAVDLAPELACSPREAEEERSRPAAAFAVGVALAKRC